MVWLMMRARCYTPGATGYSYYGALGIKVCPEWDSFETFVSDMGPRPSADHTIERKDGQADYSPTNCYWATRTTQARNRPEYNKLDLQKAREIRAKHAQGAKGTDLAQEYNTGKSNIYAVLKNETWKE